MTAQGHGLPPALRPGRSAVGRFRSFADRRANGEVAPISAIPTTTIEPPGGPSLARVAGYDLMDGGDDIINAIRQGPP